MDTALNNEGVPILPMKNTDAHCICGARMIAKIGTGLYRRPHWAHESGTAIQCDPWMTREKTPWHKRWQDLLKLGHSETVITDGTTWHIADAIGNSGVIVEFQHSPLSVETLRAREEFYTRVGNGMIWIVDMDGKQNIPLYWDLARCPVILHYPKGSLIRYKSPYISAPIS